MLLAGRGWSTGAIGTVITLGAIVGMVAVLDSTQGWSLPRGLWYPAPARWELPCIHTVMCSPVRAGKTSCFTTFNLVVRQLGDQ